MDNQMIPYCNRIENNFVSVKDHITYADGFKPYRKKNLSDQAFFGRLAWISMEKLRKLRLEHLEITESFQDRGEGIVSGLKYLHLSIMQLVGEDGRFVAQERLEAYRRQMDNLIELVDRLYLPDVLGKAFPNFTVLDRRLERLSVAAQNNLRAQQTSFANDLELYEILRQTQEAWSLADRQCRVLQKSGEYGTTTEVMANNLLVGKCRLITAGLAARLSSHHIEQNFA